MARYFTSRFSRGWGLAKHLPSAGSIYTYPAAGIHPSMGFLVGWGYSLIEMLIGLPLGIHFGPVTTFALLATILTGIMVAIYIVFNLSCILYYLRFARPEFNWFLHLVVPVVGILAFLPAWFTALGTGKAGVQRRAGGRDGRLGGRPGGSVMAREGFIEVPGGRVWYRSVGEGGTPLLCLHGGPGFTHYYLEPLEALADRRQVIFYDQLGCGRSDRPEDGALWTVDRFVEELAAVRAALGLERLHLFGSSWGGMLAMQYVLDRRPELESLILSGSPASMIRWVKDCDELLAAGPDEVRRVIREHEEAGFTACPEYQSAILGFYREHVCRLSPWPAGLERSFAEAGYAVYTAMNGPSEFTVTGSLKTWDIMDRLGEIDVPTLLVGGRYDECRPGHLEEMHRRIAGSRLAIIEDASHLCFAEQPGEFNDLVNSFLDGR